MLKVEWDNKTSFTYTYMYVVYAKKRLPKEEAGGINGIKSVLVIWYYSGVCLLLSYIICDIWLSVQHKLYHAEMYDG